MATTDKLDCAIYVEPNITPEELAKFLAELLDGSVSGPAFGRTVSTSACEIEVRNNPDQDPKRGVGGRDGFLFFSIKLEVYPEVASRHEEIVALVGKMLTWLWSRGWPAVAACDYEEDLPNKEGSHGLPFPGVPEVSERDEFSKQPGPHTPV